MDEFNFSPELQQAIDFHSRVNNVKLERPMGVSAKWWEEYSTAHKEAFANKDKPVGERGVTLETQDSDGNALSEHVIKIYGAIEGWTLSDFNYYLNKAGNNPVRVKIASPGGSASVGLTIYGLMRKRGNITTETDGPVASAASIIFLGGNKRLINKIGVSVMVHRSWLMAFFAGNAPEWNKLNDKIQGVLNNIDTAMIDILNLRSKLSKKDSEKYIDAETYFQPKECIKNGIATDYCVESDDNDSDDAAEQANATIDYPLELLAEI